MLPVVPGDRVNGSVEPITGEVINGFRFKAEDPCKILLRKVRIEGPSSRLLKSLLELCQREVRHGDQKTNESSERWLGNVERCKASFGDSSVKALPSVLKKIIKLIQPMYIIDNYPKWKWQPLNLNADLRA